MTPVLLCVSLVAAVFGACIVVPLMAHRVVSGVATMMTCHPLKYWYLWKKDSDPAELTKQKSEAEFWESPDTLLIFTCYSIGTHAGNWDPPCPVPQCCAPREVDPCKRCCR